MRGVMSSITVILVLVSVAILLWRQRTRNVAYVSAKLESYWNNLKERRKFRRFKKQLEVDCSVPEKTGNIYHSFSKDISGEGICLQVPEMMPEGSQLDLEIKIPDHSPIAVKGEIIWVTEADRDPSASERIFNAGIRFLRLSKKDKDLLSEFLEKSA